MTPRWATWLLKWWQATPEATFHSLFFSLRARGIRDQTTSTRWPSLSPIAPLLLIDTAAEASDGRRVLKPPREGLQCPSPPPRLRLNSRHCCECSHRGGSAHMVRKPGEDGQHPSANIKSVSLIKCTLGFLGGFFVLF